MIFLLALLLSAQEDTFAQNAALFKELTVAKERTPEMEERRARVMDLIVHDASACSVKTKAFFKANKKFFGCATQDGESLTEGMAFVRTADLWKRADATKDEKLAWAILPLEITGQCEEDTCELNEETHADQKFLKRFPQSTYRAAIAARYATMKADRAIDMMDTSKAGYQTLVDAIDLRLRLLDSFPASDAKTSATATLKAFRAKVVDEQKSLP